MISLCNEKQIDLLLLAGDLFENWEVAQREYPFVFQAFESIPYTIVAIVAGNHDPLSPHSLYLTKEWPQNVYIFSSDYHSILLESLQVELWGGSFSSPYQYNLMLTPKAPQKPDYLQIGLLHGTLASLGGQKEYHLIPLEAVKNSRLDYLALGHIHKPLLPTYEGQTLYAYPGSLEPLGYDEPGERGVLLGEIGKDLLSFGKTKLL